MWWFWWQLPWARRQASGIRHQAERREGFSSQASGKRAAHFCGQVQTSQLGAGLGGLRGAARAKKGGGCGRSRLCVLVHSQIPLRSQPTFPATPKEEGAPGGMCSSWTLFPFQLQALKG